ncbi:hypothetical protein ABIB82_003331 [Bradyrhizobium sp. i1.8.4]
MWGRDQAPARHEAKGRMCLMHDSHNARCESGTAGCIPLDGDLSETGRARPISDVVGKSSAQPEPFSGPADPCRGEASVGVWSSDQDEESQRDQGGRHARCDQGVVGHEVALRVQHRLMCFSGHSGPLRQPGADLCEADHTCRIFFAAVSRERPGGLRVVSAQGRYGVDGSRVSDSATQAWPGRWHGPPLAGDACRGDGAGGASGGPECSLRCQADLGRRGPSGASGADLCPSRLGLQPAQLAAPATSSTRCFRPIRRRVAAVAWPRRLP